MSDPTNTAKAAAAAAQIYAIQAAEAAGRAQGLVDNLEATILAQIQNLVAQSGFSLLFEVWFASLPTTQPTAIGAFWNNGGELAQVQQ